MRWRTVILFALAYFVVLATWNALSRPPAATRSSGPDHLTYMGDFYAPVVTIPSAEESKQPDTIELDNRTDIPAPPYILNVRIVVESDADGNLARSPEDIVKDFSVAAQLYKTIHLNFSITEAEIVDISDMEPSKRDYRADAMMHPEFMSIYYIFGHKWLMPAGMATFPWDDDRLGIFINGRHTGYFTLAHEIGHYFGLYHTFDESNRKGDFVRDTIDQADWNEEEKGPYMGYDNLMNYAVGGTRHLTSGQLERVRHYLTTRRKHQLLMRSEDLGTIEFRIDETSVFVPEEAPGLPSPVPFSQGDGE